VTPPEGRPAGGSPWLDASLRSCVWRSPQGPVRAGDPDDASAHERLKELLRDIIERQRKVSEALRDNFPP
jgi:hypothetical protein